MDALERHSQHLAGGLVPKKSHKKKKKEDGVDKLAAKGETRNRDAKVLGSETQSSLKKKKKAKLAHGGDIFSNEQVIPSVTSVIDEVNPVGKNVAREKPKKKPLQNLAADFEFKRAHKTDKAPKKPSEQLDAPFESVPDKNIEPAKKSLKFFQKATPSTNLKSSVEGGTPKVKSKRKLKNDPSSSEPKTPRRTPKAPKKGSSTDNLKQITLHESLFARGLVSAGKKSESKSSSPIANPLATRPLSIEKSSKTNKKDKTEKGKKQSKRTEKQQKSNELKTGNPEETKTIKPVELNQNVKPVANVKGKKNKKMDVVEKTSNNQKFFGQTINISDNSSDSAELKIATNEEDTSELSSEYDSSDSDHIMKSIKSFNKKGASKTQVKKGDEPPPPKPKPKIYSSSDDENSKDEDEEDDDEEEIEDEDKDGMEVDFAEEPIAKPDADDVFLDGWTKADVQELLNRMRKEIPKNDFIKAATRLNQMNWENIKFGSHSAGQCYEKWKAIEKKIRGYRILEELLCDAEHWLEQPWTDFRKGGKNKNKVQKHPEMPKKPLTTYMIFYMNKKDKIAKEFPGLSLTDLSKVIAERFNKLPPNKKAKYHAMHLAMKEEYTAKMAKFAEAHPTEMARVYGNGSRHKRRTVNMPGWSGGEKPVPPVKLYLNEKMKHHDSDPNFAELIATYKEKWKKLSAKKKLPFIRFAYEQEVQYLEDLKAYQAVNPNIDMPKYKPVLSKEERNIIAKTQGKPDKPPSSAYLLFSKTMLKNPSIKGSTPKERMQEVAKLWKNVADSEKELYKKKVSELHANYKLEYGSYLASLSDDQRKEEEQRGKSKRKGKDSEETAPPSKRSRAASKKLPNMTLEEIMKKEPQQPPKDIFELFTHDIKKQFPNKNYPAKEVKKSFDALLDEPRADLKERLDKLKQTYIIDTKKFLKSLSPEELKLYSANKNKSSANLKLDVKLSESEGTDEDDQAEEEVSEEEEEHDGYDEEEEEEEEEEEDEKNGETKTSSRKSTAVEKSANTNSAVKKEYGSSDESDCEDGEEDKADRKSSSSSSSSDSSSDEEGSSSSSSSSSSSGEEDDAETDAAAF